MTEPKYVDCTVNVESLEQTSYKDDFRREAKGVLFDDDLFRITLDRLADWVAQNERSSRSDLELLGRYLYKLIFNDAVGDAFKTSYEYFEAERERERTQDRDMRLRLKLVFERQAEILAAYPWEFIFMPLLDKGFFLSGEKTELILTRFVGVADNNLDLRPDEQPLRILVASANPSEASFDIAPFRERLEGSIGQLEQVELKWREQPRYENLIAEIESYKPHIFHFVGHGEAGRLALIRPDDEIARDEAETGRRRDAHWVDFNTFSEMFAEHKPRLVFLHACKGAATVKTTLNVFTSMARELAYSNIPAVVGMQYEIADTDAATFAEVCYRELAGGRPVDEAVSAGRRQLGRFSGPGAWGDRRFGTPLVYLQASLPIIFNAGVTNGHETQPASVTTPQTHLYRCPSPSGCTGQVAATDKFCQKCGFRVTTCPEGHVMAPGMICSQCGFDGREAAAVSPAPAEPVGSQSSFG
jgi:hypothetical protein